MAKQSAAALPLRTLVENIERAARLSGKPLTRKAIAQSVPLSAVRFSSLLKREKDGGEIPAYIIPQLRDAYASLLENVIVEAKEETVLNWQTERIVYLTSVLTYLLSKDFAAMSSAEQQEAKASIAQDASRQLDELRESGFAS